MIQSDCNLGPNILKPIKNKHRSAKNKNKISVGGGRRGALTIGWNDSPLVLSTLSCLRHLMVSSVGPFGIHGDGPESGLTLKALLYVTGLILIVSIPDICVLSYFLYSHEYRIARNTVYCAILSDQIVVGCPLDVPISY